MKSNREYMNRGFIFMQVVSLLCIVLFQPSLLGGVIPGAYKINITTDEYDLGQDTWVFEENGNFESEGLKIRSEWKQTGFDTFEIVADEQEITEAIKTYLFLAGLHPSDYSIRVKKVEITGAYRGHTITGNIVINSNITIKNPISITLKTKGNADFIGNLK